MTTRALLALATGLTFAAPSAWANYNVSAKFVCYDTGGSKLLKPNGGNDAIIALCLGVQPGDPSIADFALTFDSDSRELHVIRRCDDSIAICDLSTQLTCETAGQNDVNGINTNAACIYRVEDFGGLPVEGTMACLEKEKYSAASGKYAFATSCSGALDVGSSPCTLSFKSGRLFEESGGCPTAR
jgi:hypothetical protein